MKCQYLARIFYSYYRFSGFKGSLRQSELLHLYIGVLGAVAGTVVLLIGVLG